MRYQLIRQQRGLYSRAELAETLGIMTSTLDALRAAGIVEQPSEKVGKYKCWTTEAAGRIRLALRPRCREAPRKDGLYTQYAASKLLGINRETVRALKGPTVQVGRRIYYTPADIDELSELLKTRKRRYGPKVPEGFFCQNQAARQLGIKWVTWTKRRRVGWIPAPTRKVPGCHLKLYSVEDFEAIRKSLADRKPQGITPCALARQWKIDTGKVCYYAKRRGLGTVAGRRRYLSLADVELLSEAVFGVKGGEKKRQPKLL